MGESGEFFNIRFAGAAKFLAVVPQPAETSGFDDLRCVIPMGI